MGDRFEVVMDAHADAVLAREIARAGSLTRRALAGWASTAGVTTGGGAATVTGFQEHGDGTATLTLAAQSGASMIMDADGTAAAITFPQPVTDPAWNIGSDEWHAFIVAFQSTLEHDTLDWAGRYGTATDTGAGIVAGISDWSSTDGSMLTLLRNANTWTPGNALAKWVTPLQHVHAYPQAERAARSTSILGTQFITDWTAAAAEPWFQEAQRRERDRVWWTPTLLQAQADGVDALGLAVLHDMARAHGGADSAEFDRIVTAASAVSPPPSKGGTDAGYVDALLDQHAQALATDGDTSTDGRVAALRHLADTNSRLYSPASWPVRGATYTAVTPRTTTGSGGFGAGFGN